MAFFKSCNLVTVNGFLNNIHSGGFHFGVFLELEGKMHFEPHFGELLGSQICK